MFEKYLKFRIDDFENELSRIKGLFCNKDLSDLIYSNNASILKDFMYRSDEHKYLGLVCTIRYGSRKMLNSILNEPQIVINWNKGDIGGVCCRIISDRFTSEDTKNEFRYWIKKVVNDGGNINNTLSDERTVLNHAINQRRELIY